MKGLVGGVNTYAKRERILPDDIRSTCPRLGWILDRNGGVTEMKRELRNRGIFHASILSLLMVPMLLLFLWPLINPNIQSSPGASIIFGVGVMLFSTLLVIVWLHHVIWGGAIRGIVEFCDRSINPIEMMARMEKIWDEGFATTNGRFLADGKYLIWMAHLYSGVFTLNDVLVVLGGRIKYLEVFTIAGDVKYLSAQRQDQQEIKEYLRKHCPDILVGKEDPLVELLREEDSTLGELLDKGDAAGAKAYIRRCREERGV